MSNYNIQKLLDGSRNVVYRVAGQVDNVAAGGGSIGPGDIPVTTLIDITTLSPKPKSIRIDRVKYSQPHGVPLSVDVWWQATNNELVWAMSGGDDSDFSNFGGITNNAPPGFTGNVMFSTSGGGATPTSVMSFAFIIECVKQQVDFER